MKVWSPQSSSDSKTVYLNGLSHDMLDDDARGGFISRISIAKYNEAIDKFKAQVVSDKSQVEREKKYQVYAE